LGNKKAEVEERLIEFPISKKESFSLTNQSLLYIESKENYLSICWDAGKEVKKNMIRMTMKEAIHLIDDPFIVYCHRSFIVNLRRVEEITSNNGTSEIQFEIVEERIPISSTFKKSIKQKLRQL
jgi:DNA-binding LytR/AlgR family response regulator